jgi:murein DD-endopeptidase MepM/ murein hydrolase activator NlpD
MQLPDDLTRLKERRRPPAARALAGLLALLAVLTAGVASADLQERLDDTRAKIDRAEHEGGVLSTQIESLDSEIGRLEGAVAVLRSREAAVEADLAAKQAELDRAVAELEEAKGRLEVLRGRLRRSLATLSERLVAIYMTGTPDVASVILSSADFDDLVERTEYLNAIQHQDERIVGRVRELRDETRSLVGRLRAAKETIEAARDAIAAKERELARTRGALEAEEAALEATRGERQAALDSIEGHVHHLEGVEADLQAEIQEQIAASTAGGAPLTAGPVPAPSAAGLIWPVDGILTSGFGYRWGRMHEGIDISVPEGTPIRAAASGTVVLAAYTGGYGNYTCVDHGGGLSTCYAHQSGFAVSSGSSVSQGGIIGYSGNTGSSTGPHLHFEVRVNGVAQDPLGYL